MKLTKYQREAFVRAVMDDTPRLNDDQTKTDLQAALVKAMSPAVRKVYREAPGALKTKHTYDLFDRNGHTFIVGDANFDEVAKPWFDKVQQRKDARRQLQGVADGCTTLKQLKQLLPEFEQYMPTEEAPTKNLPVVANVVSTLVNLGWPKEVQA